MWIALLILALVAGSNCKAQEKTFSISGEIVSTKHGGKTYVFLVDRNSFNTPLAGIDTVVIIPSTDKTPFAFENVPKGRYGLRCYQDLNNNSILDKKMFVPTEPYGFSWKTEKKFPFKFQDIAFELKTNLFLTIKMED